jgi:hypothetical protein
MVLRTAFFQEWFHAERNFIAHTKRHSGALVLGGIAFPLYAVR